MTKGPINIPGHQSALINTVKFLNRNPFFVPFSVENGIQQNFPLVLAEEKSTASHFLQKIRYLKWAPGSTCNNLFHKIVSLIWINRTK